jgi:hypothetical protein
MIGEILTCGLIDVEWNWMDGILTPGYMDVEGLDNWIYERIYWLED